jgi:hypothetical protein
MEYSREVLRAHLETLALGEEGKIENRPDWQDAILTGRSEIAEGRGVPDREVEAWQQEPRRVIWALSAFRTFQIPLLKHNPEMYQVENRGRWAGLCRIPVPDWILFYAYWQADRTIYT